MNQSLLLRRSILIKRNLLGRLFTKPRFLLLTAFCLFSLFGVAQQKITGKVVAGNSTVEGATVQVKGSTVSTQTDAVGNFAINASAQATLVISFVGYETQELKLSNQTFVTVNLQLIDQVLGDVVVVGYGTQKKSTLTGSVSTVSGADITKSPSPNVTSSLQGRLPGLISNQRNGTPGRDEPDILIRGTGSVPPPGASFGDLLALNAPLVIIDGVPRDGLGRLNPEDIESISVLKDGSAAIYGARAANGVILITTKSGTRGKADFTFSYNYATNSPTKVPDVLDAPTFAEVYNEGVFYRTGRNPNYTPQFKADQIQKMRDGSDPNLNPNTDWVGLTLHDSYVKNLNFQVNGGSDKVRYLLSFGSLQQNGNFTGNTMLYKQYNFRAKVDIELLKNLNVGANISGTLKNGDYPGGGFGGNVPFVNILGANPTIVGVYPNGLLGPGRLGQSALLDDDRGYIRTSDNPLYSTFNASYKVPFIEGLKLDASFNYDLRNQLTKDWAIPYYYYDYNSVTSNYDKKQGTGLANAQLTDTYSKWETILSNFRMSYEKNFDDHHILAMVGWEQQRNNFNFSGASRRNFLSPSLDQLNQGSQAAADQGVAGSASMTAYNNYFGRVNYDFKSKYLLEFLFRYDGSQIFPEDKRYGFFPGISAGWRLSEEDFIKNALPFVSQLKLRASYGELGNDRVGAYNYLQSYFIGQNYVFGSADAPGIYSSLLANPAITWERAKKTDIGLEATLWNGKLGLDFTYWTQKRNNILYKRNLSVPTTFGFPTLPYENLGKVDSHGFELILSTRGTIVDNLTYKLSGNVAYNISKTVFLDEVPPSEDYQKYTGMPVFTGLYYKADGIFHSQAELDAYPHSANSQIGDIRIVDLNNDKKINANDQYRVPFTTIPKYVFGLNSDFQFKNFDLNIFFQGQAGVRNYDGQAAALGGTDFTNALVWRATDRWSPTNPNGSKPRADAYQPGNTTFFLLDGSFVRLKTVELGYNIPASILQKTKALKGLRVYVSAFNLATWAKEVKWADPEFNGSYFNYPPSRVINFGASIKF
ncbi:MAG: TonB-dependent receptor [Bacteroidia bacterium]|nr:TonB-dependent receptor [Bacteroidia bacterium]